MDKRDKKSTAAAATPSARAHKPQPQSSPTVPIPRDSHRKKTRIRKAQVTIKCCKLRKVVLASHGGLDITEEAGFSDMQCYVTLQGKCSACQRELKDGRGVYRQFGIMQGYAKINQKDQRKETE